jgi:hypothetical protein
MVNSLAAAITQFCSGTSGVCHRKPNLQRTDVRDWKVGIEKMPVRRNTDSRAMMGLVIESCLPQPRLPVSSNYPKNIRGKVV